MAQHDHDSVQRLARAIERGETIGALAPPVATLEDAYDLQTALVRRLGPVGGWKVSPLRPGGPPRCSPIPQRFVHVAPYRSEPPGAVPSGVEVEIGLRLGSDLIATGAGLTAQAVAAAIATVHPAMELVGSRYDAPLDAPDLDRLADLQNCAGVVLGAGVEDWRSLEFSGCAVHLDSNGTVLRGPEPQPSTERTLEAVAWLATHAAGRGLPLRAGQIIITGARLGPVPLPVHGTSLARIAGLGELRLDTAKPAARITPGQSPDQY